VAFSVGSFSTFLGGFALGRGRRIRAFGLKLRGKRGRLDLFQPFPQDIKQRLIISFIFMDI